MRELPDRQTIRLRGFNYSSSGYYFITICTQDRECLFGKIAGVLRAKPDPEYIMQLNQFGKTVQKILESLSDHHSVLVDIYQIMPNHIHMILVIPDRKLPIKHNRSGIARNAPTYQNVTAGSLSCIIRSFKSESTKQIRNLANKKIKIFQRNYYEHIIRNEKEYFAFRNYIENNPKNWKKDNENPKNLKTRY